MIWQNPWAWLGLGTLALPILIHLLGRGRARVLRFPSLRFVDATRPKPLERKRIHDPWLLAVRLAILAVAVMALAKPLVETRARKQASSSLEARVVILDTSESVRRSMTGGVDSARAAARRAEANVRAGVLVETPNPAQAIDGGVQWLARQPGKRTLVIVSDFQSGTIDSADVARVPRGVGIELVRLGMPRSDSLVALRGTSVTGDIDVHAVVVDGATDVDWRRASNPSPHAARLEMLGGVADAAVIDAVRRAALQRPVEASGDSAHGIAIVFPSYGQRAALARANEPLTDWMIGVVLRLARDSTLAVAAANDSAIAQAPGGIVIARDARGAPSVVAARDGTRLLLFENANTASVTSVALLSAAMRADAANSPAGEVDPGTTPDATLATWQRVAAPAPVSRTANAQDASDGRWLWMIVGLLLAVETWMRRDRVAVRDLGESRELAA